MWTIPHFHLQAIPHLDSLGDFQILHFHNPPNPNPVHNMEHGIFQNLEAAPTVT